MIALRNMPIKTQLFMLQISTVIVMIFIIFITYFKISMTISNNNTKYTQDMFFQISQTVSSNCKLYNNILRNIAYNGTIQDYIIEEDWSEKIRKINEVDNFIFNIQDISEGIYDVVLFNPSGHSYFLKGESEELNQLLTNLPKRINSYYSGEVKLKYAGKERFCLVIASTIYSLNHQGNGREDIGTAAIVIDTGALISKIVDISKSTLINFI